MIEEDEDEDNLTIENLAELLPPNTPRYIVLSYEVLFTFAPSPHLFSPTQLCIRHVTNASNHPQNPPLDPPPQQRFHPLTFATLSLILIPYKLVEARRRKTILPPRIPLLLSHGCQARI